MTTTCKAKRFILVFVLLPAMVQWVQEARWVQGVQGVQEVQKVQEVQWIILTTVSSLLSFPFLSSSSQYHILISHIARTRVIYI